MTSSYRYGGKRGARIKVSPPEERTYNGRVWASKAQAEYARGLDLAQRGGNVLWYIPEVTVELGNHLHKYRVDFVVCERFGIDVFENPMIRVYAVDVKGMETDKFKDHVKAWRTFGRMELHIVKRGQVEIIPGGMVHNQIL